MQLRVDPCVGGRVTSLRCGDFELLSSRDVDPENYGSTFWTSPQTDWGWPPSQPIDRGPYAFDVDRDTLTLRSAADAALGVRVTKRFRADHERQAFVLRYTVVNVSDASRKYAPWQVTRVRPNGVTFAGLAGRRPSDDATSTSTSTSTATWFAHQAVLPATGQKTFARETGGMLAHARDGHLFVKVFEPVPLPMQAPGEAAIEIYANDRYVELEVQGRYERIEPGCAISWSVTWYLRKLPPDVPLIAGSERLTHFAARLTRRSSNANGK
jgi:hypothetical protein